MKTVRIPIYGGRLIVVRSQKEFNHAYDKVLDSGGLVSDTESITLCGGGSTSSQVIENELVIVSGVFDRRGSTRCHEATHCAQIVAEAVGMNPIAETEAFAYLVQWFYEELAP